MNTEILGVAVQIVLMVVVYYKSWPWWYCLIRLGAT